jgi:hypothetical protein
MAVPLSQMVWAVTLLDYCPDVDVLSVRVHMDPWMGPGGLVDVAEVGVHVRGWENAARLAATLRLAEGAGRTSERFDGAALGWRTWSGWVPDGSRDLPVRVEVIASEVIASGVFARVVADVPVGVA